MSKKIKKISKVVSIVLIIVTALLMLFVIVSKMTGKPIFIFNKSVMWVVTDSMAPEIQEHTYILVEKVDKSDVKINDVITFYSEDPQIIALGGLNTHRIVGIDDNGYYITKGDNNYTEDKYTVNPDKIVSRYICVLPVMTAIGRFLLWGPGIIIVIVLLAVLIAVIYIPEVVKISKQVSEQKAAEQKQAEINKRIQEEVEKLKQADKNNKE